MLLVDHSLHRLLRVRLSLFPYPGLERTAVYLASQQLMSEEGGQNFFNLVRFTLLILVQLCELTLQSYLGLVLVVVQISGSADAGGT